MKKFVWGKVLDRFTYDFDGIVMEVVKFHPWKVDGCTVLSGKADEALTRYHCEELGESSDSIQYLLLSWIAHRNLGLNQRALVSGVAKAMGVYQRLNQPPRTERPEEMAA